LLGGAGCGRRRHAAGCDQRGAAAASLHPRHRVPAVLGQSLTHHLRSRSSMRESKREKILQAAVAVVQRDGVTALTYESVAAESGLTKGGLLYHFPSREDMVNALHTYVADRWEQAMVAEAGAGAEQLDDDAR